jgi:hypothetical protein
MEIELEALRHACHHGREPNARLAAAGYQRWVGPSGDVMVLQDRPRLGGPWLAEDLAAPSRVASPG